jgi:hypothetical protein
MRLLKVSNFCQAAWWARCYGTRSPLKNIRARGRIIFLYFPRSVRARALKIRQNAVAPSWDTYSIVVESLVVKPTEGPALPASPPVGLHGYTHTSVHTSVTHTHNYLHSMGPYTGSPYYVYTLNRSEDPVPVQLYT